MLLQSVNFAAMPTASASKRGKREQHDEFKPSEEIVDATAAFKAARQALKAATEALVKAASDIEVNPKDFQVKPGSRIDLQKMDPSAPSWLPDDHDLLRALTEANLKKIDKLQEKLYAEHKHKIMIVFQAMDTGGKDGSIEKLCTGMNPQGVNVACFKAPSAREMDQVPLQRVMEEVPRTGQVGIMNRSHYEDVLWPRVHDKIDAEKAHQRMGHINNFEEMLTDEGTTILKFFLHIDKDEQKARLEDRRDEPDKNWKLSEADIKERAFWDDYQDVYSDTLSRTSTKNAPWHVIPAEDKKVRDFVISCIVLQKLESLDIGPPAAQCDVSKLIIK